MLFTFASFFFGLILLLLGSHQMVQEAIGIAKKYQVPPLLIGTLLVGFGTSVPELLVSTNALLHGSVGLCVGNALGSYIGNIGLVLGFSALVRPISIPSSVLTHDLPLLSIALMSAVFLVIDGDLSVIDSCLLVILLFGYVLVSFTNSPLNAPSTAPKVTDGSIWWLLTKFVFFMLLLLLGSEIIVQTATAIAKDFGLSELVVGLSVVAVGTSLPELATALMSLYAREDELCVGNIIGSNIFCLLGILPLPALVTFDSIATENLWREFSVMIVMTLLFWIFAAKFDNNKQINRIEGGTLLLSFCVYIVSLFH